MRGLLTVSIALTLVSTPAFAADDPKEKKICKRTDEGRTGSHLRGASRVCRTASEWRDLEDGVERDIRAITDKAVVDRDGSSPAAGPTPNPQN